jgi:hypothetical protein
MRSQATATSSATSPTNTTATQPSAGAYWPYEKVVAHLAGRSLAFAHGTVHLQSALLECNGNGVPLRIGGTRSWSRYTCTQTTFQGGADHDVTFDVVISSATQLTISSPRTGPE